MEIQNLLYSNSLAWATRALASRNRGVTIQSNDKGRLNKINISFLHTRKKYHKTPAHTTIPALTVSSVFGTIGFPVSSFTAEMLAAQRRQAMLIKSESSAMYRPTQILMKAHTLVGSAATSTQLLVLVPRSKALMRERYRKQEDN